MPQEHKSRREVLDAIKTLPSISDLLASHDGHFDYEIDLEVVVYGRNYNGKKVGPYVRLLTYDPGEAIVIEGDWGGNTFYLVVDNHVDVFINTQDKGELKVAELKPGAQFGEMSLLAGVPRNATVRAPIAAKARILEVQRPALRLLRKLPRFGDALDNTYRLHGRNNTLDELKEIAQLTPEMVDSLKNIAQFKVLSKNHVLFRENAPIDRIYIIKEGWINRTRVGGGRLEDYTGSGFCFGTEGILRNEAWPYTATLMGRTEVLEFAIGRLRGDSRLREALARGLPRFAPPNLGSSSTRNDAVQEKYLAAERKLIDTGLVDATNLLVMDMDLCVRCGNCSLACHKIHGQSRLLRRGIHLTRLQAPKVSAIQSVLAPGVCMHCQDPECLTGCPTGAIGRFGAGQIDISQSSCIGCGDCATQCPYNAITMVPRKPKQDALKDAGFASGLRDYLRLKSDPLPPPVEQTDELVAVKCNLCTDTPLNPPKVKKRAYSCEENCPTGALARIDPRKYFTEIEEIEGLMLIDRTHAIGRNIHKSDPPRRLLHLAGILLTLAATALAVIGLERYGFGRSLFGFLNMRWITGLAGLIGIAAVMTYPFRRQVYRKRAGPLRYWMPAHSYLGVLAGIMILLHGGTDSGGALTTTLMITFDVVIATGLFGIVCYLIVPRLLTKIEGTPLLIDDLKARREELEEEIGRLAGSPSSTLNSLVRSQVVPRFVSLGFLMRQYLKRENLDEMLEVAKAEFKGASGITDEERLSLFRAVEAAATLRRIDALVYLHRILKLWLAPHVASTSLMLALMLVHIIQVVYYASW